MGFETLQSPGGMDVIEVIISGITGRMGSRVGQLVDREEGMHIVGGTTIPGDRVVGEDICRAIGGEPRGTIITSDLREIIDEGDVIVDFSVPSATLKTLELAVEFGKAMVIGTTGFDEEEERRLEELSTQIPVVRSPNLSMGMNLLFKLVETGVRCLRTSFDMEVIEAHHKAKRDAPSGTAKRLVEIVRQASGLAEKAEIVHGREDTDRLRGRDEIGVHAIRGGDVVGDHTVLFLGEGERLEITHRAQSRDAFARGAITAIRFVAQAEKGQYSMFDVLGIE